MGKGAARMELICSMVLFAGCQGLLLYCAGYTVYQTVPHTAEGWTDWRGLLTNRTFVDLAASLMVCFKHCSLIRVMSARSGRRRRRNARTPTLVVCAIDRTDK